MKTVTDGDGLFAPMWNSLASLWLAGTAVLSGCTLTGSGSALQITVGAGTATAAGVSVTVGGGTAAVTANAGTETRYDLLYATGAGALGIALGGTSTPALPGGCIPLAVLEIGPGQTTVPADRIHDCRALASKVVAASVTIEDTADPYPAGLLWAYPSDTAITTSATERSYAGNGSSIVKTIAVPASGVYRVTCDLRVNNELQYGYAEILRNGLVVATFGALTSSYVTRTADLAALAGEEFDLRLLSTDPAFQVSAKNFTIRGACAIIPKALRTVPAGTVVLD